ncbi:MAG: hypothetical protein HY720_12280 [Planctomycetes bacterium]|nr:hypothetical protein [Planctomycetota bacterium]
MKNTIGFRGIGLLAVLALLLGAGSLRAQDPGNDRDALFLSSDALTILAEDGEVYRFLPADGSGRCITWNGGKEEVYEFSGEIGETEICGRFSRKEGEGLAVGFDLRMSFSGDYASIEKTMEGRTVTGSGTLTRPANRAADSRAIIWHVTAIESARYSDGHLDRGFRIVGDFQLGWGSHTVVFHINNVPIPRERIVAHIVNGRVEWFYVIDGLQMLRDGQDNILYMKHHHNSHSDGKHYIFRFDSSQVPVGGVKAFYVRPYPLASGAAAGE